MNPSFVPYRQAAAYLQSRLKQAGLEAPSIGIVCGSGLSGLSSILDSTRTILTVQYGDIPGFPASCTVSGHKGEVVFGVLRGGDEHASSSIMIFRGRFHSFEGHDMQVVCLPVRVMRCLCVKVLLMTNAAGGLNPSYNVGDVAIVVDHIALPLLAGSRNPLVGLNDDELGPRFPPTSNMYLKELRTVALQAAKELQYGFIRDEACYCWVSGPNYESKAECRFLQQVGGDLVGMSTIPELLAAHHGGIKVLCLSLVTNKVLFPDDEDATDANHEEVLEAGKNRAIDMQSLVEVIVTKLHDEILPSLPDLEPVNLDVAEGGKGFRLNKYLWGMAILASVALLTTKAAKKC